MNIILLSKDDFSGPKGKVSLNGRRHKHILEVLKASVGDELCVGVAGGLIGTGRVTAIDKTSVEMETALDREPPRKLPLKLVLALPRPIVFKRLLAQITALGVKSVVVINSARVDKSYWKSLSLKDEKIGEELARGLEQAKDTILPEVKFQPSFRRFLEDDMPRIVNEGRLFLAHPYASSFRPDKSVGQSAVIVGPDGGFVTHEIEALKTLGCEPVSIGERILRVETAVVAFISAFL